MGVSNLQKVRNVMTGTEEMATDVVQLVKLRQDGIVTHEDASLIVVMV